MSQPALRDLEAFCHHCPKESDVTAILQTLGFRLAFQMGPFTPPESSDVPALPPQYHYADQHGTEIVYLAGRDTPEDGERFPFHASRFWLWPGADAQAHARSATLLASTYHFRWVDTETVQYRKQIA